VLSRLQNLLLAVWILILLLLAAFNWPLVSRSEPVGFLFMAFEISWGLWIVVLGAAVALLLRLLAWTENRHLARRTQAELTWLKAKAFDERSGELESMARTLQERLEQSMRSLLGQRGASGSGSGEPPKS
jgi:uncharacterized integral membrane protein